VSPATIEREAATAAVAHEPLFDFGGGPTLEDVISGVWEGLSAGSPAACLACGGELRPEHVPGGGFVGGTCRSCGTSLS
jgi:hypothetical protein